MNKEEIKDLFKMAERTNKPCVEMNRRTLYMLKEYIEEVQQENEWLKEMEKEHQKMNGELREVIKKAIEYIESNPLVMVGDYKYYVNDLLQMEEFSTELSFIRTLIKILNKSK